MKIINLFLALGFLAFSSCNSNLKTLTIGKKIDDRLVGVWCGSEKDQQVEGVEKKWEMTRREDGTFTLDFITTQYGVSNKTVETGNWWIDNGKFYEYHDVSGNTDVYKYIVLDSKRIKFISVNMSMEMNNENYEFIDTRKEIKL
jgi:Lipocalin-like domain